MRSTPPGRAERGRELLDVLDGHVDALLARHVDRAKAWYPHEFVADEARQEPPTDPDDPRWPLRSAVYVNLLTEDNLPYYTAEVDRWFGPGGAWGAWARRWTAEEGRHAIALRQWVH